ncbi:isoleucine--tRNA ligase [Tichowtungia aerotolerans]|uniref:Isoleucine--tRNA ligase n=2 Tax=Tichowtungia aerotolerans TaxID=2697043 RepID=A0A6P1MA95_9BACT|nr:isoleucine--tRNA ligase [Tichowtungia aerotolerans]
MFKPVSSKVDFAAMEEGILAFWAENETFKKSIENRSADNEYVFYDGPPFATGLPHYGHLLAGTIKDIVPRYQTMRGHRVERRFGWDCHGLPIEALAQDALGLAGAPAIVDAGIDVFNEKCRSMVSTYVEEWEKTVTRMGRWVDFQNDYKTMDKDFMETIWWVFSELWKQGRIYRAHRIMPYSWKLNTPLSNFEAGRNYQDVQDPSVTVRVKLKGFDIENACALVWTTTPWTLPSNLAICAGPDIDYVAVRDEESGDVFVLAEARLSAYYKKEEQYDVLKKMKGSDLKGLTYEPLFDYFKDNENSFVVLNDDFVSTEDGSGIVHMAPAYGEDDYRICSAGNIPLVEPLDVDCKFTSQVPEYEGQFCKDADKAIIKRLKDEGKLIHQSTIQHSYPFCERTDTPLIYRAIDAWYVRVEDLRDEMLANNEQIHWTPEHVGTRRFANWLADAKDWNISRNRFWGSCIPVWVNVDDPDDTICVGSAAELEELSGKKVTDLHKHFVDEILIEKDGKTYKRTPEVLDCWFESGSMPYAQQHYPFENREHFEGNFPAQFIAEGLDQTRGWFYTLMVLSTALFKKPAFKNVVVNGLVLAEDGHKMSKSKKNYPDPLHVVHEYGADALRLYMINSPIVKGESLRFSEEGVKHALRHLLIPLWNSYSFFVTYANVDGWTPDGTRPGQSENLLDRWIESSLANLCQEVTAAMDSYDLQRAVRPFVAFIEDLTNWYIRRSRRRFWKSDDDGDKQQAYVTLYHTLIELCKIAAPFTPFIADEIYRNLRTDDMPESVHLCDFPTAAGAKRDEDLEKQMRIVMDVVVMGRQLRKDNDAKVRQPLRRLDVVSRDSELLNQVDELKEIIEEELNVRSVVFGDDESGFATLTAKANFKALGPRFGKQMKAVASAIANLDDAALKAVAAGGSTDIVLEGETFELTANDVLVAHEPKEGLAVQTQGALVVALDLELDDDLIREGLARELVKEVQNLRKTSGLEVTDRINLTVSSDEAVSEAIAAYDEYIKNEVLALTIETAQVDGEQADLNGHQCVIALQKA